MTAGLETDAVHRLIHLGLADDLLDLLAEGGVLAQVHRLAAEAARLLQPFGNQVADDDDRSAQQLRAGGTG